MVHIDEIKAVITDREEELRQKFKNEVIIEREHFQEMQKVAATDAAIIITGVRRCGKSIFAFMLGKSQRSAYINFEDERLQLSSSDLNKVLEAVYSLKGDVDLLIFDEIQNVPGWEMFVSRLLPNKKIIITGSNARLLSSELSTFLTGRHINFSLFPFSFRELLRYHQFTPNMNLTKDIAKIKAYAESYLKEGGFPLRYKLGPLFLVETYKDILERDIIQRYSIKHGKAFKDLAKYLITNSSQEWSYNKLKNMLQVKSVHTIANYISYLEAASLIFTLERFSFKLKEQVMAPKKAYCIDTGMALAIGFSFGENRGKIMENAVAVELSRKAHQFPELELYYWKDHQQREVDFILKKGRKVIQLLQVCYDPSNISTREREVQSLLKASKELRCTNALIITFDHQEEQRVQGITIHYVPLWRWLLTGTPAHR